MKAPVLEVLFYKETLAQVFSREFCEVFKNTFFHRAPLVAPSEVINYIRI